MKLLAAAKRSRYSTGKIQPLILFLMGAGFLALGLRTYPAFIGVGGLFLVTAGLFSPDGRKWRETETESSFHRFQRSTGATFRSELTNQ